MKFLSIGLVLAIPVLIGCGQAFNQTSMTPNGGVQGIAPSHIRPNNPCGHNDAGTSSAGGFIRWNQCAGMIGRMTYGSGTTGNDKLDIYTSTTNPGGIPIPPGETAVLFAQQFVRPTDPSAVTFTGPPPPPPATNRSRITGVAPGTYQLNVYNGATLIAGPFVLGSPTPAGVLRFMAAPYSPLPFIGTQPLGSTYTFELDTP